jgi:hypothetical protein
MALQVRSQVEEEPGLCSGKRATPAYDCAERTKQRCGSEGGRTPDQVDDALHQLHTAKDAVGLALGLGFRSAGLAFDALDIRTQTLLAARRSAENRSTAR